jgi:NADH-quinone oxidoreductase subunit L
LLDLKLITSILVLCPLLGAMVAALLAKKIGHRGAHSITILLVFYSFLAACYLAFVVFQSPNTSFNIVLYKWISIGTVDFKISFLVDKLSVLMALIVTFISLLVHVYSVGYMHNDKGYQRFFSYVSLFTFAMLMLVMADNLLQLFFGWEGVGVVSYLLIGFYFTKDRAASGGLKAFLVNRVGDFGFILALGAIFSVVGSLDYNEIFGAIALLKKYEIVLTSNLSINAISCICFCLFIGAMGKSAQIPLHVWLPESMEGPTPISALIHAATMVTAGIYLLVRMSPIFEYAPEILNMILFIGASGGLFLGLVGLVQNDIKRVVAYSTLSQLGYMIAATGASAYNIAIFHLVTHAFFKALLFLAAGAVIVAMHHEQDMRKMGGLRKHLPLIFWACLVGSLALIAIPPFAGFYSKDAIIEVVALSNLPAASWAHFCLLSGVFVTSLYTFRAFFMTFMGKSRFAASYKVEPISWAISMPLVVLSICSIVAGFMLAPAMLDPDHGFLANIAYNTLSSYTNIAAIYEPYQLGSNIIIEAFSHLPIYLSLLGVAVAYYAYLINTKVPEVMAQKFAVLHRVLVAKYGFDTFNDWFFVRGSKTISKYFYNIGDKLIIDDFIIHGSANLIQKAAAGLRLSQSGYIYHYIFAMMSGLILFIIWLLII